jgi:hypothetical protein
MKKVRYALGAAGAIPAIGLMAPATTAAANTPAHKTTAKTVSLRHTSATPAASGCTGNTEAKASNISITLKFWHTYHPSFGTSCIGTVETSFFAGLTGSSDRVRIYAHSLGGKKHLAYSHLEPARTDTHFFAVGVHKSFGYPPIQVCTAAVSFDTVRQGPLCKSVG